MANNAIRNALTFVVESYEQWFRALRSPNSAVRGALRHPRREDKIRAATDLWFAAFFLSLLISLPIYYGYGLKIENASFHLCYVVVAQYSILAIVAYLLHVGFRVYGVDSRATDTFVIVAVLTAVTMPFLTLFALPSERRLLSIIRIMRTERLSFTELLQIHGQSIAESVTGVEAFLEALGRPFALLTGMGVLALFVRTAADHYRAPIPRVLRALTFSALVVAPIPAAAMAALYFGLYYAFVT